MQLPKELQHAITRSGKTLLIASMKCSSRRNCNRGGTPPVVPVGGGLNEVQLPKELQLAGLVWIVGDRVSLNEVQLPKELQRALVHPYVDLCVPQ